MSTPLPWQFEECDPENARDDAGTPWQHAVRGRKPAGRVVVGYGHNPSDADHDARTKATQYDAREVLGQRGEIVAPPELPALRIVLRTSDDYTQQMLTVYDRTTGEALIQGRLVEMDVYMPPFPRVASWGSSWPMFDMPMMSIGT